MLIETHRLTKSFEHLGRRIDVLKDIDLSLDHGERVAILGKSGAGKSTLLHVLGTLDVPTSGSIRIDGKNVVTMAGRRLAEFRNRTIGFMFQFHHLLPEFSALENVALPALIGRRSISDANREARHWLDAVELSHRLDHRPGELSGGEQQRVALARALMGKPALLLADEPTGNLDSQTSDGIHRLFTQINAVHGTTLLVVTHNPDLAARMPRRMTMVDGHLVEHSDAAGAQSGSPQNQ